MSTRSPEEGKNLWKWKKKIGSRLFVTSSGKKSREWAGGCARMAAGARPKWREAPEKQVASTAIFSFFLLAVTFLTKWTRAPKRAKKWEKKIFIMSRSFSEDEDLERSDFAVLLCRHVNTRSVDCPSQSFNAIGVFGCFHFSAMTCLFCFNRFAIFFWPTFTLKGCCEPNKEFGLSVRRAIESCAI